MVKVRMNTADVAAEVKCLRRLIGMRCSNVYDLSPKTYMFKLMNSSGITESGESEKVLLLIESGIRLHTTDYVRDKSNTPSGFTLKLRKHIRTRRLEDVRQLGYDRIVIFQFGLGADAHYVILELYALGNIILTDSDFMVLTLLRSHRDDDKGVAIMFRHHYPTEICRVFERTTAAKLHAAFTSREPDYNKPDKDTEGGTNEPDSSNEKQSSRKGGKSSESSKNSSDGARAKQVTLKTVLGEALGYGQALSEHIILDGGLVPNTKISKENMLDDNTIHVLVQAVARFEDWLQDVISGDKIPEGYILMQKSGKEPGGSGQIYDEFCPILLNQFRLRENVKFDTFDAALDEFYSKIESQWSEQQQKAKESSANQKLNKICLDQLSCRRLVWNRLLWHRQQNSAAIKIQKCYKGRKEVEAEHSKVREQFYGIYGKQCQNVDRQCFGPESDFFQQLFFFFNAHNVGDCLVLVETCRLLQQFVQHGVSGCVTTNTLNLFAAMDYSCKHSLVDNRVKQLSFSCIWATHQNRNQLKDQLLISPDECSPTTLLLEAVVLLIDPKLPWACKIIGYLMQRNAFALFRDIVLTAKESAKSNNYVNNTSSLERVLTLIVSHTGEKPCICPVIDPEWNFSSQILTVPFLWQLFPCLKEVFATRALSEHYVHQMAICVKNHATVLPNDTSAEFPGCVCLLGNILEIAGVALSQPDCSFEMARDYAAVATLLLEALPQIKSSKESSTLGDGAMDANDDITEIVLNSGLEKQISNAIDPRFLLQLTNVLFRGISLVSGSQSDGPDDREVAAVGAACAFLHVTFNTLPLERIMTILAYRTELVPVLWNFMKRCHKIKKWSSLSQQFPYLPGDAPGWLLPLSVFCPVYKHMLTIVDNEEFYEHEKPLSLKDIKCLIVILRQALWQVLWSDPKATSSLGRLHNTAHKRNPVEFIQYRVSIVASDLLSQLQDWNNRRQFAPPSDFHADGVTDSFISQAVIENTRAHDILKQAPFLIPFTSRVKIFVSQLAAVRQRHGSHAVFTRSRFKIRRDHILEDAYNQMSELSEEDLRGLIRVTFVNELGVEEAGIDGGGIFKDFMENIARAAFDVQYGLFKETADHLLFPNPGSGMIHEQHLQFFHFLGKLLSKAMFEGILVDIPFATFFLSKLKQKYNYLNDLPSLDPELYRHLIFLKHFEGDISELELYFVIVNNEYGEQMEEELLPGGKDIRVTNENVITFIHLVANHRLNFQIRQQSSHFLRGFQQLIPKDWIVMFNEHELQLLISGSLDSLDVDDLRDHSNYAGGYHSEHHVIEMFWEVLKGFSLENQKKFLKFTTGCSRGPLLGFKYLEPIFCIQRTAGNANEEALDRLPTSATCMNLLKLPPYRSKEQLEMKLMYAINAEAGFDLS